MRVFVYRRAGAVVIDGDSVLLISMQPPGGAQWFHFPGGGIEDDESADEAACRELYEETGLKASSSVEYLRAGVHGGQHEYFLMTCDDLQLGAVTGPELDYAAGHDFRAEWVPIADLASLAVWPRCVAEYVAARGAAGSEVVPWFEDDRSSWDGVSNGAPPIMVRLVARAVIAGAGGVAAIERTFDDSTWFTLPGGGIEPGETPELAAVREVREELGIDVVPRARLAVVSFNRGEHRSLQTYIWCEAVDGEFGAGTGDEFGPARVAARGTYRPVWLDASNLPSTLRPAWLANRLGAWIAEPDPVRPERFCEVHDDE